jgi:hypothetical protein
VLFASGFAEERISVRGVLAQGVHFIAQPFEPHVLLERVARVLASDDPGVVAVPSERS